MINEQKAYFAAGCFWCVEAIFQRITGVVGVISGYCNGNNEIPNYQKVCTGQTNYAEVIEVIFDSNIITFSSLLEVFFATHDATTLNKQGADSGTQYRSGIFYINDKQKQQALTYINSLHTRDKITTEVAPLAIFYKAEDYHQNYFNNNQNNAYCQAVINPKITKYFSK